MELVDWSGGVGVVMGYGFVDVAVANDDLQMDGVTVIFLFVCLFAFVVTVT